MLQGVFQRGTLRTLFAPPLRTPATKLATKIAKSVA